MIEAGPRRELVLVGGGHAHVQVLRRFAMEPPPGARVTLVVDTPIAVYSGMVPGFVAGQYRAEELEIDVVPLARRARARVLLAAATGIDRAAKRVLLAGRPAIPYDLVSFDVGSTVAGLDTPGVREHALSTRPIGRFVRRIDAWLAARPPEAPPPRVAIVGGGAGGVELAFALRHRLEKDGTAPRVTLLEGGARILPRSPPSPYGRVLRALERSGIEVRANATVATVEATRVVLAGGDEIAADLVVWVTGAVAHGLLRDAGLALDERGFVLVRDTLQTRDDDSVFAVGDCATLASRPTPKAGVFAVRQGPVLTRNLVAALAGRPLEPYQPQRDFLALLNFGDGPIGEGNAIAAKWGFAFEGRWVLRLKDWIDRRFMRRFQVLAADHGLAAEFQGGMTMPPMLCGGCAAKLGETSLERALARIAPGEPDASVVLGLEHGDDAAAVRTPGGDLVTLSVDAFPSCTDDPYLVGRVGAVNAMSDLWAKGVEPRWAMAVVGVPQDEEPTAAEETLAQALAGARAAFDPAGVRLIGGHTTTGPTLTVGFTVFGVSAALPMPKHGLRPGLALILTKALGTGVVFRADGLGEARGPWLQAALASMSRPNADAARLARETGSPAATDVTGFGLAGHLASLLKASGVAAELDVAALPALPGALELLRRGVRSTFHPENARARHAIEVDAVAAADPRFELLFDPQTSGGLLFGVDPARADDLVGALHAAGDEAAVVIGRTVDETPGGARIRVRRG